MLLLAPTASASHYLIADVPDVVPKAHHQALRDAGIVNTQQLYERIVRRKGRRSLAAGTRIAVRDLAKWARFLDLMQLDGIGPKMVRLLNAAGVGTLRAFQKSKAGSLHPVMRAANRAGRYSEVVPGVEVVRSWIRKARTIKVRLE